MELSVFQKRRRIDTAEDLRTALSYRHEAQFGAFWLAADKCPSIGLFINRDSACLFFIREEGDSGFHSLGQQPDNFEDETEFLTDNDQSDLYPTGDAVMGFSCVPLVKQYFPLLDCV